MFFVLVKKANIVPHENIKLNKTIDLYLYFQTVGKCLKKKTTFFEAHRPPKIKHNLSIKRRLGLHKIKNVFMQEIVKKKTQWKQNTECKIKIYQ